MQVGKYQDGIALARINKEYGFVNSGNIIVVPIKYHSAMNLGAGIVVVSSGGKFSSEVEGEWDRGHGNAYLVESYEGKWDCINTNTNNILVSSINGRIQGLLVSDPLYHNPSDWTPGTFFIYVLDGYVHVAGKQYRIDT